MINVIDCGGGVWIAKTDIDMTDYAVVSSENPDFLTVYSKFNDAQIFKMHADRLSINYAVLHDRLLYFLQQKSRL